METVPYNFAHLISVEDDGCWRWTGYVHPSGYPIINRKGLDSHYAHRAVYLQEVGEIPEGLFLDHLCHDPHFCAGGRGCLHRRCVRPSHLACVTNAENSARGGNANVDGWCKNGLHVWTGEEEACPECRIATKRRYGTKKVPCPVCGFAGMQKHLNRHMLGRHGISRATYLVGS